MIIDLSKPPRPKRPKHYRVDPDHYLFQVLVNRLKQGKYTVQLTDGKEYSVGEDLTVGKDGFYVTNK